MATEDLSRSLEPGFYFILCGDYTKTKKALSVSQTVKQQYFSIDQIQGENGNDNVDKNKQKKHFYFFDEYDRDEENQVFYLYSNFPPLSATNASPSASE